MNDTNALVSSKEFFEQLVGKLGADVCEYIQVHELDGRLVVLSSFEHIQQAPVFSATDDLAFEHGYRHNCSLTMASGVQFGTSVLSR